MAKIARAKIVPPEQMSLMESANQAIVRVLRPGASTVRYRRTWRIGLTSVVLDDDTLYSRIGFEGAHTTIVWDEETKDFQRAPIPSGQVVPFAIDLKDLTVAFQTRPPEIKVNSFTGALQGVLRDQTSEPDWRVESRIRRVTFDEWRSTVEKVTHLHFRAERPNPNWEGRPDLEEIFNQLGGLDQAEFDFQAEGGINTDASLVRQLLAQVERYGRGVAVGMRKINGETIESVMDTEHGEAEEWTLPEETEAGEVAPEALREELRRTDSS